MTKSSPLIGDFREYGSKNSGSCRSSRRGRGDRTRGEEILLALGQTSPESTTLLGGRGGDGKSASILAGLAGPSSLARFFERFAVLRFAYRVARYSQFYGCGLETDSADEVNETP